MKTILIIMIILGVLLFALEVIIGAMGAGIAVSGKKILKVMDEKPGISFLIIWGVFSIILYGDIRVFIKGELIFLVMYLGITGIEYLRKKQRIKTINAWVDEGKDINIDVDCTFANIIANITDGSESTQTYYDYRNMPYGRAKSFIREFGNVYLDDEYYFFEPVRTKNVYDIRENGLLIAKSGIYMSYEEKNPEGANQVIHRRLEFAKLYSFYSENKKCTMINSAGDGFDTWRWGTFGFERVHSGLDKVVERVCQNRIPQVINYYEMQGNTEEVNEVNVSQPLDISTIGMWAGNESRMKAYEEQKNYMGGSQGHGYAAEYGNLVVDKMLRKNVINEAQNLDPLTNRQRKDGADRIVNGNYIQTKYYKDFNNLYNEVFPNGEIRYTANGKAMQIEVP